MDWPIGGSGEVIGKARWAMGRLNRHGMWADFKLVCWTRIEAIKWQRNAQKHNFNTLTILYMYIPQIPIKIFPKNVGYAQEYLGTTIDPPMGVAKLLFVDGSATLAAS
jgi:hypothetical protein